jgi:hypothetical protein
LYAERNWFGRPKGINEIEPVQRRRAETEGEFAQWTETE